MRASRWLVIFLAAVLAGAASAPPAQADTRVRVYLGLGDIRFDAGRNPYYRHDHSPVYVAYDHWGNRRYYRYAAPRPRYYGRPSFHAPAPGYYYRPAPRPYYRGSRWDRRDDRFDQRFDHRHEGRYDRRDDEDRDGDRRGDDGRYDYRRRR